MRGYSDYDRSNAKPHGQTAAQIAADAKRAGESYIPGRQSAPVAVAAPSESRRTVLARAGLNS